MKAIRLLMVLLMLTCTARNGYSAVLSVPGDSLKPSAKPPGPKGNGQYSVSMAGRSGSLKWLAVRKWYYKNSDTILVFNSQRTGQAVLTLHKLTDLRFMNEDLLLASGNGRAEFHHLRSGKRIAYDQVLQVSSLKMKGKHMLYAILHQDGTLKVYRNDNTLVQQLGHVKSLQTVDDTGFIVNTNTSETADLVRIDPSGTIMPLYRTDGEIRQVILSTDQQYALIEEMPEGGQRIKAIYLETGTVSLQNLNLPETGIDEMEMSPIGKSGSYLVQLRKRTAPDPDMPEIWYGNESDLGSVYNSRSSKTFLIWYPGHDTAEQLQAAPGEMFVAFTSSRYLLKYHPRKGHNYTAWVPTIELRLYDIAAKNEMILGKYAGINSKSPEIIYSPDGRFIMGSRDRQSWEAWDLEKMTMAKMPGEGLKTPYFASDGRSIYFDSRKGVWKYEISSGRLSTPDPGNGYETTILNGIASRQFNEYYFGSHSVDLSKPLLYRNYDFELNETGYRMIKKGQARPVIPFTGNRIRDLNWDSTPEQLSYFEENHNLPTALFILRGIGNKTKVFQSNLHDHLAPTLAKEVIHYTNKGGQALQGTLYYPADFDPEKKYPMVVKIYQIQRYGTNEYMIGGNASYVAYDKRGLIERGYFVFEPDIAYGNEGTGYGALDCVNRAMDAIGKNNSIDFAKVALLGHSHGGYSTNFIATQSNRFATYISGAGNSDIVRSYFSYNRNFHAPFYFQFESGQYEMPPFSGNKELYFKNNPIHYAEHVNAPILLWAGKKDENIFWEQVQEFYIGLKRNRKDVIALFYHNVGHDLGRETMQKEDMHRRASEWLDYFLKDKKEVEWINKQMSRSN